MVELGLPHSAIHWEVVLALEAAHSVVYENGCKDTQSNRGPKQSNCHIEPEVDD